MRRAAGLLLVVLFAATGAAQDAAPPEDCAPEGGGFLCEWTFEAGPQPGDPDVGGQSSFREIPIRGSMLLTVTVRFEGDDNGWEVWLLRYPEGDRAPTNSTRTVHVGNDEPSTFTTETVSLLARSNGSDVHVLYLLTGNQDGPLPGQRQSDPMIGSRGTFTIVALIEPLPEGTRPSRPAATALDPHLSDVERDAREPEYDILAFWLDDAALGDRLFDAHLLVAGDATVNTPRGTTGQEGFILWKAALRVGDDAWELWWFAGPGEPGCNVRRVVGDERPPVGYPICSLDFEAGRLDATLAEGFLGEPASGVRIEVDRVWTESAVFAQAVVEDEASRARYPFALGGPSVWSELNPRLDPPSLQAAWYQAPLARDNLPDTLSVLGALLAAVTFLVGVVAVQRNRRRTRDILERIDALVRAHDADARAALRALGELESDFDRLYRQRRINETQYQLAQQRIVAAASRLALRKEFGLDDGAPG